MHGKLEVKEYYVNNRKFKNQTPDSVPLPHIKRAQV